MLNPKVYKCASTILPQARTAVFTLLKISASNRLIFKEYYKDDKNEKDSGFTSAWFGDSGAPYWTMERTRNGELATIVSVHTGQDSQYVKRIKAGRMGTNEACDMVVTKITKDILKWIKSTAGIKDTVVH